jgi:hypothetical protein
MVSCSIVHPLIKDQGLKLNDVKVIEQRLLSEGFHFSLAVLHRPRKKMRNWYLALGFAASRHDLLWSQMS